MSFETTTQVRTFFGSTPTDGSQFTQTMSPRRSSRPSDLVVIHELDLRCRELFQCRARVGAPRGIVGGQLLPPLGGLPAGQALAHEVAGEVGAAGTGPFGVSFETGKRVRIECQIEPHHDTSIAPLRHARAAYRPAASNLTAAPRWIRSPPSTTLATTPPSSTRTTTTCATVAPPASSTRPII